jgi:outer membrane protein assembly factor BamB
MLSRNHRRPGLFWPILVLCCQACSVCIAAEAQETDQGMLARRLLAAADVRGGLVVHVGCGDGRLALALRADDSYLVHGLDDDADNVQRAREHVRSHGACGSVSVDRWSGGRLPYVGNLVNLLVVEDPGDVPVDELMRVLRPGGTAMVAGDRGPVAGAEEIEIGGTRWWKLVKPWPEEIDDWTHYLHDATGNAVAHDEVVGPPHHVRWIGPPEHARQHDHLASLSAMVSAAGRVFAIVDEGPIGDVVLPAQWTLVARDAFNGIELWRRPIPSWENHLRRFRSGPAELPRRLVAAGDRVYVTLGYDAPVSALDAATGETVKTYEGTEGTLEIVHHEGILYLVLGRPRALEPESGLGSRGPFVRPSSGPKRVVALEADTGEVVWTKADGETADVFPLTLAVDGPRVLMHGEEHVLCLDRRTGREIWRHARPADPKRPGWSSPTLVAWRDVVLVGDRNPETTEPAGDAPRSGKEYWTFYRGGPGRLVALSAEDGRELWSCPCAESFHAPVDVFVADGLVWTGQNHARWLGGELHWLKTGDDWYKEEPTLGRDPQTGEVKRRLWAGDAFAPTLHHRCYRNKATERFMLLGRIGVEFIDLEAGAPLRHNWIRGTCQYGILPANGLLYVTPHSCACYIQSKLNGFWALAPKRNDARTARDQGRRAREQDAVTPRLEGGSAYSQLPTPGSQLPTPSDWPTYRHDPARSGATGASVPAELKRAWQADLGGRLTSVVVAGGKVFASQVDAHTVHALAAENGEALWSYTAGGRVDSPPTVAQARVVFGSADGCVYCLRAADGALVWRYRAAPDDRRIVHCGRLESVWPVPGSVLVEDDVVYGTAGRSSYLDGGMCLFRLDLKTGRPLSETRLSSRDPKTGGQPEDKVEGFELPGTLPDVLSYDGAHVFLRDAVFDRQGVRQDRRVRHLYCPRGFLDDAWWHRTYWLFGTHFYSGAGGWPRAGREFPSGRLLVVSDDTIYGFGRRPEYYRWTTANEYHLFATAKDPQAAKQPVGQGRKRRGGPRWRPTWSEQIPLHARAMVLAGKTLFVAGPPDPADEGAPQAFVLDNPLSEGALDRALAAWRGEQGALLWAVSAEDGRKLSAYELESPPVWDGMAAASGRLFVSLGSGCVQCWGPGR